VYEGGCAGGFVFARRSAEDDGVTAQGKRVQIVEQSSIRNDISLYSEDYREQWRRK
jgi:hypothetical protein